MLPEAVPEAPRSSVTVSTTAYVPGAAYAWTAVIPCAVAPSPKDQEYDSIDPSESVEPDASNATESPGLTRTGVIASTAAGAWFWRTTTLLHLVSVHPTESATVRTTRYVPGCAYTCE